MRGGDNCLQKQLPDTCELLGDEFSEGGVGLHENPEDGLLVGDGQGHVVKMALELFG